MLSERCASVIVRELGPVSVTPFEERIAPLHSLVGHVGQPGRLPGKDLLAHQPIVGEVESKFEHTDCLRRLGGNDPCVLEREVFELMAQGRSNSAVAEALHVSQGTVEKYISAIFAKLGLAPGDQDHRRVLAVLKYLGVA